MDRLKNIPLFFRIGYVFVLIIAFIGLIGGLMNKSVPVPDNPNQQPIYGDGWGITGIRDSRPSLFREVKATDVLVFFGYSDCIVDAYDYDGEFQFSILTRDSQNGAVSIWCVNDMLYLRPKTGDILIFRGTEFVGTITHEGAMEQGIFQSETNVVTVNREYVYRMDETGNQTILFATPEEIVRNLDRHDNEVQIVFVIIAFALVYFVYRLILDKQQTRKME